MSFRTPELIAAKLYQKKECLRLPDLTTKKSLTFSLKYS